MTAFRIFTMVVSGLFVAYLLLSVVGLIAILFGAKPSVLLSPQMVYQSLAHDGAAPLVAFLAIINAAIGLNSQAPPAGPNSNT